MGPRVDLGRVALLGVSVAVGFAASGVAPGCIFPDYCIVVKTQGTDWCLVMEEAIQWPEGEPDLAEPVSTQGGGAPRGCRCFNDADVAILQDGLPVDIFGGLVGEMEADARNECALAVPPGYDHNCYVEDGALAPGFGPVYGEGPSDDCIGSCAYIKPPPNGSCGDPDPYECNQLYGGGETGIDATETRDGDPTDLGPANVTPDGLEVLR